MNILENIVAEKKKEVAQKKVRLPLSLMENSGYTSRTCISAVDSISRNAVAVIAEYKRQSPSKGVINPNAVNTEVTKGYEKSGAAGVSILTDYPFFGGSGNDLLDCRPHLNIPVLRKDFLVDEYQVFESKWLGADIILLIAACLSPEEVQTMAQRAKELGMQVLLELHTAGELAHVCDEVDLVGINNRNLKNFAVSLDHSIALAEKLPADKLKLAESGIHDAAAGARLLNAGFNALLIGEYFMRTENPGQALADFRQEVQNHLEKY